ncbi:MAG: FecR domain-containing protein [Bacteroidia bacterium]|nr:FecR domain-containing protein [Bacteroidia bacterium]
MSNEENNYNELGKILSGTSSGTEVPKDIRDIWDISASYTYKEDQNTDQAWAQLSSKLSADAPVLKVSWIKKYQWAIAASLGLMLVAGAGAWLASKNNVDTATLSAAQHFKTGNMELKTLTLQDGSIVTLNSNSELILETGFNENGRKLTLIGEANFEVAKNPAMPFVVTAGETKTTVLGTGFNIQAYANENVTILVKHGKVSFSKGQNKLILTKDQAAKTTGTAIENISANALHAIDWQNGSLEFKKVTLNEVVNTVSHRYGRKLTINVKDGNREFTGKFQRNTSIEEIAEIISVTMQVPVSVK